MLNDFADNNENLAVASIIKQDVAEFIKCTKNCVELSLRYGDRSGVWVDPALASPRQPYPSLSSLSYLQYCHKLRDMFKEKSPVHVPDNYKVVDPRFISHSLKSF
jgi:hypothetical protein